MAPKRVLIVDDDRSLVRALAVRCKALGLDVRTSYDGMEAAFELMVIHNDPPDLIVMDIGLPVENGLTICEMVSEDLLLVPVPVIILTGKHDNATIERCKELGAYYVHKGADTWNRLKQIITELFALDGDRSATGPLAVPPKAGNESGSAGRPTVVCIDDDRDFCRVVELQLGRRGLNVITAHNGVVGFWKTLREKPDAVLADFCMPGGNGAYVLREIARHPATKHIPVIIVTGKRDATLESNSRALGAAAYFTKPIDFDIVTNELAHILDVVLDVVLDVPIGRSVKS